MLERASVHLSLRVMQFRLHDDSLLGSRLFDILVQHDIEASSKRVSEACIACYLHLRFPAETRNLARATRSSLFASL